jgi:elongation factor Tu
LINALDRDIHDPAWDYDSPCVMPIEGVNTIAGRGTVVTGRVDRGVIRTGDTVEIIGLDNAEDRQVVVTGTQAFRKDIPVAKAGMNVGLLLRGVKRDEVQRGQVLTIPGVVKPYHKAKAHIFVLSKDEGGRHTPFGSGYQPQFFFGTTDVTGVLSIEKGVRFAIREGSKGEAL